MSKSRLKTNSAQLKLKLGLSLAKIKVQISKIESCCIWPFLNVFGYFLPPDFQCPYTVGVIWSMSKSDPTCFPFHQLQTSTQCNQVLRGSQCISHVYHTTIVEMVKFVFHKTPKSHLTSYLNIEYNWIQYFKILIVSKDSFR